MNRNSVFRPTRSVAAAVVVTALVSLSAGWAVRAAVSGTGSPAPKGGSASPAALAPGLPQAGQGVDLAASGSTTVSSGTASSGTGTASIAYPFPGYGSLGAAPEGAILAAGTGTADMKADGSDRAAALAKATTAALADARSQATAVATAMGAQLGAIYSVSVSSSESAVYPLTGCVVPSVPVVPQSSGATTNSSSAGLPACIQGKTATPTSMQIVVGVVVAYRFS
jgi:hypothetical protein